MSPGAGAGVESRGSAWRGLDVGGYRPWGLVLGLTQGLLACERTGPGGFLALGLSLGGSIGPEGGSAMGILA